VATLLVHSIVFGLACVVLLVVPSELFRGVFGGVVGTELLLLVSALYDNFGRLRLIVWSLWHRNAEVYVSVSALVRIADGHKLLLVYSKRRNQLHPIGGALRRSVVVVPPFPYRTAVDPEQRPNNELDLRLRIAGKHLATAVAWVVSGVDRETSPWREIDEELLAVDGIDRSTFGPLVTRFTRRHTTGPERVPGPRPYYRVRVFEIHDAEPNQSQLATLKHEVPGSAVEADPKRSTLCWMHRNEIPGLVSGESGNALRVGDHTVILLD